MFKDTKIFFSYSVDDLQKAKHFYAKILGVEVAETTEGLSVTLAGGSKLFLYPKPNHVPAEFTVLNFSVPDAEKIVAELKQRGVNFEAYPAPTKTDFDNIARLNVGPAKIAWFRDPAGNILSVLQERK